MGRLRPPVAPSLSVPQPARREEVVPWSSVADSSGVTTEDGMGTAQDGNEQGGIANNSRGAASLLKDVIPITEFSASGLLEGPDLLRRGFTSVKNELLPTHPLELSEKNVQRLPFLYSSNIALDTLRGNDESIGFEDILNDPSQSEVMGEPHMMMEYKLGLF
ncbi:proteasome maturation protein isoform X2 [Falco biarmicus]|uniref:proteasome maturation protein isoform X2 n=1 Tax=Falco cherrug TaxID=345164 RepID=UPI00247932B7|nr:proteasome maturation protein isoform X2 [Falco cherrug]XP_056183044.1 proteasome maturation protein isoform X2 [Falco biarmicus]